MVVFAKHTLCLLVNRWEFKLSFGRKLAPHRRCYLPPKLLGELLQVLQVKQCLLQGSLSLMFSSLQQNPTLLYVTQSFTFKHTKHNDGKCRKCGFMEGQKSH